MMLNDKKRKKEKTGYPAQQNGSSQHLQNIQNTESEKKTRRK